MDFIIQRQPYNFTIFSIAGQIFFMNIASLVYSLPCIHKSHLNCWYLFHCVPLLSQEPLLSPFLLPHILSLNKHPLKKKKSKENLCSPFLFDFPHIAVNHSPNTDGRQTWTLALVAFSQEIFSSILWFTLLKRNCPFQVFFSPHQEPVICEQYHFGRKSL